MLDSLENDFPQQNIEQVLQLLEEVELNTSESVRKQRSHARRQVRAGLTLRPGNASQRNDLALSGMTADISESGCQVVFTQPCRVGDIYFLEFDPEMLELPKVFARCLRCRLIREDQFEAGFCFFTQIALPAQLLT